MCNAVLLCWIVIPFAESAWHLAAWAAAVQRHPVGRLG